MLVKNTYIAFDGEEFEDAYDCHEYERKQYEKKELSFAMKMIKEYCENYCCDECLYNDNGNCYFNQNIPNTWNV